MFCFEKAICLIEQARLVLADVGGTCRPAASRTTRWSGLRNMEELLARIMAQAVVTPTDDDARTRARATRLRGRLGRDPDVGAAGRGGVVPEEQQEAAGGLLEDIEQ
jgi:hypothetical protein